MIRDNIVKSSFRDPSGFLFYRGNRLLRQVNQSYKKDYDFLMDSGLYQMLTEKELLVAHKETKEKIGLDDNFYKIIEPDLVSFISYPYEWSFDQYKDAALVTLRIQKIAMQYGMTLKDGSAYNVQFLRGRPIFIDTLSFEIYQEGKPWEAYKQFCQHFLAPLALMNYTDIRLNQLMKNYIDGIPLDLTSKLLPFRTKFKFSLLMHLHVHAKAQKKYEKKGSAAKKTKISRSNSNAITLNLINAIGKLKIKNQKTEWGDYYDFTNYTDTSFARKKEIILNFLNGIKPNNLWDLGANTGEFTRIGSDLGASCVAFDIDPVAVNTHYLNLKANEIKNVLPLIMDLTNPSPAIGWNSEERSSLNQRSRPDCVMALALIHHLAISNNLPFGKIAKFLHDLSDELIIEFVPKSDSQVKILLESRKDIFPYYTIDDFVREFEIFYSITSKELVSDSERVLFWMTKK